MLGAGRRTFTIVGHSGDGCLNGVNSPLVPWFARGFLPSLSSLWVIRGDMGSSEIYLVMSSLVRDFCARMG
jgi:hypothetical protein